MRPFAFPPPGHPPPPPPFPLALGVNISTRISTTRPPFRRLKSASFTLSQPLLSHPPFPPTPSRKPMAQTLRMNAQSSRIRKTKPDNNLENIRFLHHLEAFAATIPRIPFPPPPQHSVEPNVSISSPLPPASEAKPENIQSVQSAIFHLFPSLPAEIRLKIWSLLSPRTITFLPDGAPPPAILSVCREARAEIQSQYAIENLRPRRSSILLEEERGVAFINYKLDILNVSGFQISIRDNVVQLFLLAQTIYPSYLRKLQRIMVGTPMKFQGERGFKEWWHFEPWKLIDTACGKCRHITFVFGGDKRTQLEDAVDMTEVRLVTRDEEKSMAIVRESLEKAREEGYCIGLEVRFARDKKRLSGRVDLV